MKSSSELMEARGGSGDIWTTEEDSSSPLDFSTKRKKLETKEVSSVKSVKPQELEKQGRDKLRKKLSMKSPSICGDIESSHSGAARNLSEESPKSHRHKSESSSSSTSSSPLLPSMETLRFIPSPRLAANPATLTSPQLGAPHFLSSMNSTGNLGLGANGANYSHVTISPYGVCSSPVVSPAINQAMEPGTPAGLYELAEQIHRAGRADYCQTYLPFPFQHGLNSRVAAGKAPVRPFKAYPNPNLKGASAEMYNALGGLGAGTEALLQQQSNQSYAAFREQMMRTTFQSRTRRVASRNARGQEDDAECADNEFERQDDLRSMDQDGDEMSDKLFAEDECRLSIGKNGQKRDQSYWERRKKNNEAAKRSRDARRAKEDEIAIRAAYLEQENLKLRIELMRLTAEIERFRPKF